VYIAQPHERPATVLNNAFAVDIDPVDGPSILGSRAPPAEGIVLIEDFSAEPPARWVLGITGSLHVDTTQGSGCRSYGCQCCRRCGKPRAQCDRQRRNGGDLLHVLPP